MGVPLSDIMLGTAVVAEWVKGLTNGKEVMRQPVHGMSVLVGYTPNTKGIVQVATHQLAFPGTGWQPIGQLEARSNPVAKSTEWWHAVPLDTLSIFRVQRYHRRADGTSGKKHEAYVLATPDRITLCDGEVGSAAQLVACVTSLMQHGLSQPQADEVIAITGTRFAADAITTALAAHAMLNGRGASGYLGRLVHMKLRDKRNAFDLMNVTPSSSHADNLKLIARGAQKIAQFAWGA